MREDALLRRALRANAVFSVVAGSIMAFGSSQLAELAGVPAVIVLVVGLGVVVFGIGIALNAYRREINRPMAAFTVYADVAWVLGAIVVIAWPGLLTTEGALLLVGISLVVAALGYQQWVGLRRLEGRAAGQIVTEVFIDAEPEEVWAVLVDLDDYREWNPLIVEGQGQIEVGERLQLKLQPTSGRSMTFRPVVTHSDEAAAVEWLGTLGLPGIFDGRHRFELDHEGSGTRLTHSEQFDGVLVPMLRGTLEGSTRQGFIDMNSAIKARVETRVA